MKTLIVCDVQPDVVQKLAQPRQFVDLVHTALAAARQRPESVHIVFTMLQFQEPGYSQIPPSHPRLGILRKLASKNPHLKWFTSQELSLLPQCEKIMRRSTYLPQANDTELLEHLRTCAQNNQETHEFTLVGYGPTVQALCNLLGDVLAIPNVQIVKECIRDEKQERCRAFLENGLLFKEEVVSLADYLESLDLLHERIETPKEQLSSSSPLPAVRYVCDCGRGGHLSLFLPYLLRDHGYCLWPRQPWYKELSLTSNKEYYCPLGRRIVDLCDEPQFGSGTRFFLAGRQHLDEKDLLHSLVPEMMPPTFATVEEARVYAAKQQDASQKLVWFLKKVNQNGGRAITITNEVPAGPLESDDQLQVHIPRPLLYHENHERQGKFKCHVKTYQYLACNRSSITEGSVVWQLYMHDLFYLATAYAPWCPSDLSDDAQITTMRTHRLYPDNEWRVKWNLTDRVRANMTTVIQRAVAQGKLQEQHSTAPPQSTIDTASAMQFEVNSADWMLDEDGRIYLIEINGIPVLYDAGESQELCTKGLKLYDRLYNENPESAVVNDHDLLQEAIGLALTGKLPKSSLWTHIISIPSPS